MKHEPFVNKKVKEKKKHEPFIKPFVKKKHEKLQKKKKTWAIHSSGRAYINYYINFVWLLIDIECILGFDPHARAGVYFFKKIWCYLIFMSLFRIGQKTRIQKIEPIPIRISSTKSEPKLIKYLNYSKFWYLKNWNLI